MKISNDNINKLIIDGVRPDQLQDIEALQCRYDSRQDFYKKAYTGDVLFSRGTQKVTYLKSYNTIVACIWQNQLRIYGWFSQTTARHIREFAKQNGFFDEITKQDMLNQSVFSK